VLFYSRTLNRVIRPGLSQIAHPNFPRDGSKLTAAFRHLETELTNYLAQKKRPVKKLDSSKSNFSFQGL
jgi:hypothetical protein